MKILLVEDEEALRKPVKRYLEKNRFLVDEAEDGDRCIELLKLSQYDCVLLDLNLPGMDGLSIAKTIRKNGDTVPIIMITARSQIYDKLEGFENGADDYITKPFSLKEMVARVHAVIKRSSLNKEDRLRLAQYELFPEKNIIYDTKKKFDIELSNKEVGVLEYLIRNKGEIVSSEELLEHVWDSEVDLFSDTVKTHIKTIRKKIDPSKRILKTVRGKGYMLTE